MSPKDYAEQLINTHNNIIKDKATAKICALHTSKEILELLNYINSEEIILPKIHNFHKEVNLLLINI